MSHDLGERAALECAERLSIVKPQRLVLLTTWHLLQQLESAQRIQSADMVMEAARQSGRFATRVRLWSDHDPNVQHAVMNILRR